MSAQIKELQLRVSDLSPYIVETGSYLLDAIQHANDKNKSDEMFDLFYKTNGQMLIEARKLLAYANIRAEILKRQDLVFSYECESITKYSYELLDILEWYNKEAEKTPIKYFNDLCDKVQQKLILSTSKIEGILFNYCVKLGN